MRIAILMVLTAALSACWTPRLPQPRPPVVITQAEDGGLVKIRHAPVKESHGAGVVSGGDWGVVGHLPAREG